MKSWGVIDLTVFFQKNNNIMTYLFLKS